jgi:hypothetical protein
MWSAAALLPLFSPGKDEPIVGKFSKPTPLLQKTPAPQRMAR